MDYSIDGFKVEPAFFTYIYETLKINNVHEIQKKEESFDSNTPLLVIGSLSILGVGAGAFIYNRLKKRIKSNENY